MSKFGWSYPPGCTQRHIDEAFGGSDSLCECCGEDPSECKCPECPKCGEVGRPQCYENVNDNHHGLSFSDDQNIARAQMRIVRLQEEIDDERQFIAYIKDKKARAQDDDTPF